MAMNFSLDGREIGPDQPPYVVAEMSGNHNGNIDRAFAIIEAAKEAGADAVKMQTYTADTITIDHDGPGFTIEGGLWDGRTLHELYEEAHTPWDWHQALFDKAREVGIVLFSAPFDPTAVEFLESLDAPAYKIASFEAIDLPLIAKTASTGKPIIISTGMADLPEIEEAVGAARNAGAQEILVLHCVSGYPAPASDSNLATIPDLARKLGVPVGLSDHTLGTAVPIAAIAQGAVLIEKHLTLDRDDGGPDAAFSLEPDELKGLVDGVRTAWQAFGKPHYERKESEKGNVIFRRSLYVVEDIDDNGVFTNRNVRSIRPGFGLPPKHLPEILGRRATRALKRGDPLDWDMVGDA
ncbi:MAG TPA: pseudaminic acid synthase [Rhodospirillaceae bacterium]|nr:pseudaminic acid synthase [Rhodospirillaceae bacterium]